MSFLLLPLAVLTLGAVGGSLLWHVAQRRRAAAESRTQTRRWASFVAQAAEPTPGTMEPAYPVVAQPGIAGEIVVRPDGLCLLLAAHPGRTVWVPWRSVRRLEPTDKGGAVLRLISGLDLTLGVVACRAVWEAQTAVRRLRPIPPGQFAATAS